MSIQYCESRKEILKHLNHCLSGSHDICENKAFGILSLHAHLQLGFVLNCTINVERFTGLNICGFSTMKFLWEYFPSALGSSTII